MNNTTIDSYLEVQRVLNLISETERNMIPNNILNSIMSYKNYNSTDFKLKYDLNGQFLLSKNASDMLFYLYYTYIIGDNEIIKNDINIRLRQNKKIKDIINNHISNGIVLRELFNKSKRIKQQIIIENNNISENKMIIKEENIITKIINKIKKILLSFYK